jgi:hypothetical protein
VVASRLLIIVGITISAVFAQYSVTANLSEPVETRWKRFGSVYFRTNEKVLNKFYAEFENVGGVMVGVSFQQNFSLLAHARPELYVVLDINPAVTEVLVPFFGELMTAAPTRREFLSRLLAVDVASEDVGRLLEGKDAGSPGEVYAGLVQKTAPLRREQLQRQWKETLERILARLPLDKYKKSEVLRWQKILDDEEYATGEFFMDSILPYTMSGDPSTQKKLAGWLSTEENYQLVRRYWTEGKIVGVTGDIGGPSVGKLAEWLRKSGKQVSGIYLSDVGTALAGAGTPAHFARLYENLGQLPLRPGSRVLISHGGQLTAYSRTYRDAVWLYGYLSDVDYSTFYRLNANVLQAVTRAGPRALMPAFRQEFQKLTQDKSQRNEPIPAETIAVYSQFLDRAEAAKSTIKTLSVGAFTLWARKNVPGLDTAGALFRTTAATLKDAGAIAGR